MALDSAEALYRSISKAAKENRADDLAPLGQWSDEKAAALVLDLISDSKVNGATREAITALVAGWPEADGKKALADFLLRKPDCDEQLLLFFSKLRLPAAQAVFWKIFSQTKGRPFEALKGVPRIGIAIRGLGCYPDQNEMGVGHIAAMLDVKAPHPLRASAADALGGIRHLKALEPLIAQVRDQAIGEIAQRSLFRLTGQDHGEEMELWKEWLASQGAQPPLLMLGLKEWEVHCKAKAVAAAAKAEADGEMGDFYGMKVRFNNALFILDCSGSMDGARLSKLKAQMNNLLTALATRGTRLRYGIITFGDRFDSCLGTRGLLENDEAGIKKASRFVERMAADGGTPMLGALTLAHKSLVADENVDTIYFLSDGDPTDGTPEMVLDVGRELFDFQQVRINTVEIRDLVQPVVPEGQPPSPPSLLEQMATISGGKFQTK